MSRTYRRGFKTSKFNPGSGGRKPKIVEVNDCESSHSKDCYLCCAGKKAKRNFWIKPRRRKEKIFLRNEINHELSILESEDED